MTNLEMLSNCIDEEDSIEWLMNFVLDMFGENISDEAIRDYLRYEGYEDVSDFKEDQYTFREPEGSIRRREKRKNDIKHKRKIKKKYDEIKGAFYHPFGYYPVDKHGKYTEDPDNTAYYKRYDSPHEATKFLKKQSNRKIRRMDVDNDVAFKGGDYKKMFDYWWELY